MMYLQIKYLIIATGITNFRKKRKKMIFKIIFFCDKLVNIYLTLNQMSHIHHQHQAH